MSSNYCDKLPHLLPLFFQYNLFDFEEQIFENFSQDSQSYNSFTHFFPSDDLDVLVENVGLPLPKICPFTLLIDYTFSISLKLCLPGLFEQSLILVRRLVEHRRFKWLHHTLVYPLVCRWVDVLLNMVKFMLLSLLNVLLFQFEFVESLFVQKHGLFKVWDVIVTHKLLTLARWWSVWWHFLQAESWALVLF